MKLDGARPVRPGEEIDAAALERWVAGRIPDFPGPLAIEQFPSGHSNLTYLVRSASGQEFVLRRPPVGSTVKTAHDMGREHRILSALAGRYPRAPRPIAACDDASVLGAPFYLMERVRGVILRGSAQPRSGPIDEATMRRASEALVDALVELHAVDWRAAGLADLGRPEGYIERQVRGWTERYRNARTDDIPDVERAAGWIAERRPAEPTPARAALIHNDFKYDNLVLDPEDLGHVRAILDWEMATVGDPLLDLGTSLAYWVEPGDPEEMRALPVGPTALPGNLTRAEVLARYEARSGRRVDDALFYYVYGLFKVAVILQQIYFRYTKGLTKDERFAALIVGVAILGRHAARAIDRGSV